MKFVTDCVLSAGKVAELKSPNLAKYCKIPNKVTISVYDDNDREVPATGIQCRIYSGGTEIIHWSEPSFRMTNEIDLSPFIGIIERLGTLKISLTNRTTNPLKIRVYTDYIHSYGSLLVEDKLDHFDNVLNDIYNKGYCTRIVLSFNKPIESLQFASVATCLEGGDSWVHSFNVPASSDPEAFYNIDLTSEELGPLYSDNLNFLEIRAQPKKSAGDDRSVFYMYVMAYGFPRLT